MTLERLEPGWPLAIRIVLWQRKFHATESAWVDSGMYLAL